MGDNRHYDNRAQVAIELLAREIARQNSPTSVLFTASTPHEIARALYLQGWRPPYEKSESDDNSSGGIS